MIYSPSDLINYMESPFTSWMDRLYMDRPPNLRPDGVDSGTALLQRKGDQHETAFLEQLRAENRDIFEIPVDYSIDAIQLTKTAIANGHEVIYQGVLALGEFEGRSDFLVRKNGIEPPFYEVWDTKLARKSKPYFLVQLCCYAEMLAQIQGAIPEQIAVVLGDKTIHRFNTRDYIDYFRNLKRNFLQFQAEFDPENMPAPDAVHELSRWRSFAEKLILERDDLIQVANIRRTTKRKIEKGGIKTLQALSETSLERMPGVMQSTWDTLKQQARLQVQSKGLDRPLYEVLLRSPEDVRGGLALLPPESSLDVYFDMEGYPHFEGGLEYLFGAVTRSSDTGEVGFHDWWAHDRDSEKIAFEQFIDWVYARWRQDRNMHIYHYAAYEVSALRRLMGRHATRERQVDNLLRHEVFIDLYSVVKQSIRVGEPSYSIKYIEHLYKDKRGSEVATAMDSVVQFDKWLEEPDSMDPMESAILRSIRDYNEEDCVSTLQLTDFLRGLQRKHNVQWIPIKKNKPPKDTDEVLASDKLAQELLLRSEIATNPEDARVDILLAHLLGFHARETKPAFWRMFDWHSKTEEELIEDKDCLGGLIRTGAPVQQVNKSEEYEYTFNPDQDTVLVEGDKCIVAHDLSLSPTISYLDAENGFVRLKRAAGLSALPDRLSLIPSEIMKATSIEQSLQRIAQRRLTDGSLPSALSDFLHRTTPRLHGRDANQPLVIESTTEQILHAVRAMDRTTLFIQGPPGCGKTYTAAHVIVSLLQDGKRIGVSSNSHKAIENLLTEIDAVATKRSVFLNGVKIGSDDKGTKATRYSTDQIDWKPGGKKAFENKKAYNLYGGTAFALAIPEAAAQMDYLFVDEAGQVAIANLAGMAPCAENIVLIGDQMQLDQPLQGSHPGESGQSTLQYLLQDNTTVPPTHGIFLDKTWRMHPSLCRFISDTIYDGRLTNAPVTEKRVLVLPHNLRLITREAGLLYCPAKHQDNTRCSREEAELVEQITQELLTCRLREEDVERAVTLDDILFVAPYNLQVKLIRERIPGANVASVDKFQGREAPVVILCMCTSDAASAPRGLDFIFSRNRMNVAISRARTLAVVIGNADLANAPCTTVEQMALVNLYCSVMNYGRAADLATAPASATKNR
ncbi:MAG: TM0106 family RecB-like putative nuclease [Candidatus Obscuribacterales bacterium]|nr:TM0106 family RecB-like putative nuclease [Candidatus Obscuribacterales bacterium]